MGYQIGTAEPRGSIGSRPARSDILREALEEARQFSRFRYVKESWLRKRNGWELGRVIATFKQGKKVENLE